MPLGLLIVLSDTGIDIFQGETLGISKYISKL